MDRLRRWWSGGRRVALRVGREERSVFVRRVGEGPAMTLLHGFPSSSHDWAKLAPAQEARSTPVVMSRRMTS